MTDTVPPDRNAGWYAATWLIPVTKLGGAGLSFLLFAGMARLLPAGDFAAVALVLTWLALGNALVSLCLPAVVVHTLTQALARGEHAEGRGVLLFACLVPLTLSMVLMLAGLLAAGACLSPAMAAAARAGLWLLAPSTLLLVFSGVLQAFKRVVAAEVLCNSVRSVCMLAILLVLYLFGGGPLSAVTILHAYLLATLLTLVMCGSFVLRILPAALRGIRAQFAARAWLRTASGFMGIMLLAALAERIDLLVMGWIAPAEVAVFAVAARFLQPLTVACAAAGAAVIPHLMEHIDVISTGRGGSVAVMVRHSARVMLAMAALGLVGIGLTGHWIIGLFGPGYAPALAPLLILLAGQTLAMLFGPANQVAAFTGAAMVALSSIALGIVVNVGLNVLLAPRYGAVGTAFASASGNLTVACAAWWQVRTACGIDCSIFSHTSTS